MLRKTMLYKTEVEYGDYTMNHVLGCAHGCKYPCYAYLQKKRFGEVKSYEEWCNPKIVENTLELLDKELPKLKNKIQTVHLCFTTDPFMYHYKEVQNMSLAAIKKINAAGIKCTILTKGLLPNELATFSKENEYGITLISLNEEYRKRVEPRAASYKDRLNALRYLHDTGCKTWVSIEPYPTPNLIKQNLDDILGAIDFTDKIIFGRMNYNKEVAAYQNHRFFYNEQAEKVVAFCNKRGISYHIKNGTTTGGGKR